MNAAMPSALAVRPEEQRASGWTSVSGWLCFEAAANCSGEADETGCQQAQGCGFGDWAGPCGPGADGGDGDVVEESADVGVVTRIGVVDELELVGSAGGDGDELVDDHSAGEVVAGEGEGLGVAAEVHGRLGGVSTLGADKVEAEIVGAGGESDAGDQIAVCVSAGAAEIDALAGFGAGAERAEVRAANYVNVGAVDGVELTGLRDGETVDGIVKVLGEDGGRVQWNGDHCKHWQAGQHVLQKGMLHLVNPWVVREFLLTYG
jgi:hypothetical protein